MGNRITIGIILLLSLVFCGWGVYWFLDNFERRTRELRVDPAPFAQRNPLLAAERFLDRIGIPSESVSGRDYLYNPPQQTGLLLVNRLGGSLPPERQQVLMEWVAAGGHLVVSAQALWDEDQETSGNTLLDELGVQPIGLESLLDEDQDPARQEALKQTAPLRFEMPDREEQLEVAFSRNRVLLDSQGRAEWWVESILGAHLLQFQIGAGRITVLSDNAYLMNDQIDKHDHALFLADLAKGQARAWLLYSSNMPSLLTLLWRHAWMLVVSVSALLLLLIWSHSRRSGPLLADERERRRDLLEHLAAAGQYLWRVDRSERSFKRTQQAIEQAWRKRHPVLEPMTPAARSEWIAEHAGMDPGWVMRALYGKYAGEQVFIQLTAVQQRLAVRLNSRA